MEKSEQIVQLEKIFNFNLNLVGNENIISRIAHKNCYQIDKDNNVIAINLSGNGINEIKGLDEFVYLEKLVIEENEITEIKGVNNLLNLKDLYLSNNRISEIKNLENLKNLRFLDLSYNKLKKISGLDGLSKLYDLKLNWNEKLDTIEGLHNLVNLEWLSINGTEINKIKNLENVINLRYLYLGANKIKKIEGLENLKKLRSIYLSYNQITKIENLDDLPDLHNIRIRNNQINNLNQISNLKKLKNLDISNNYISNFEDIKELLELKYLNQIIINNNIILENNNIILGSEKNHYDVIINEIIKYQAAKIRVRLPLKICLLGNHACGKSTFLNYFFSSEIETSNSTHILQISQFKNKKVKDEIPQAIFYDFGGQDYYHGVYKAFLTQSSTNLLFWNKNSDVNKYKTDSKGEKNINFNRRYWLGQIDYVDQLDEFTSDQKNIFQIQTYSEKHHQDILLNDNTIRHVYLSLDKLSFENNKMYNLTLHSFKEEILNIITNRPEKEVASEEFDLYKFIVNNKKLNEIKVSQLLPFYHKKKSEMNLLKAELDQLSKKGLVLYYKNSLDLNDVVWLNPAKTVRDIYRIFNEVTLRKYNGEVPQNIFEAKIKNKNLLELLKYNKVIFFDNKSDPAKYIIPGYLKSTTDEDDDYFIFGDFNQFNFILKFENFIPFGFINQLICLYGGNPEKKFYKKDQLVFTAKNQNAKVLVKLDYEKLIISVGIIPKENNFDTKTLEREIFFDILNTYLDKNIENEQIELEENQIRDTDILLTEKKYNKFPNDLYLSTDNKNFIHYNLLESDEFSSSLINGYRININNSGLDFDKTVILKSLNFKHFSNNKNIKNMKKIFISYSHEDVIEKQRLMTFLKPLERSGKINIWQDLKLQAGVEVQQEIFDKLDEADIIIMLVSQDFIGSDFIYNHELQNAMKKRIENKVKILPIMISDCTIFDLDLYIDNDEDQKVKMGDYYFVPQDEKNNIKPIRLWESHLQDSAWKKVYEALKKLME
ncbi:leucine-rich repeat domain-containing protein [Chryseobacterium sp. GVT01B]|uniref:leucine-rich repeat domain-containing protein n=1 Tax=Chryseobacterium sp. GVT01B TaxID=2862675 RepID=UPI001CBBF6B1|nr:leucine-rich repeat domain-containing protein [Chryseobacterium sp. GVT01B]